MSHPTPHQIAARIRATVQAAGKPPTRIDVGPDGSVSVRFDEAATAPTEFDAWKQRPRRVA